ncbi:uncharacterized protein BYT42DRAFT_88340 [Radiomyces spectabilis]|uniref:uncharacterized protein n=1 Tax=Radiomyces spectabilis TaxID=64574 RepID=UPI0022211708|nr:uncharacterized protein BYT42DRAFT_88340 [Radiomyces spectabilis]KAI8370427.1 hypothetical protein BYT42DRAFT_88340 [Radiomyces spectabilis]
MSRLCYVYIALAIIIAIFAITAWLAMTRLLAFHVRLSFLNMTTIEYINHPSRQTSLFDDSDDSDDEDEESDFDRWGNDTLYTDDTNAWHRPWSPSLMEGPPSAGQQMMLSLSNYLWHPWRMLSRYLIPGYRYRVLSRKRKRSKWWRWLYYAQRPRSRHNRRLRPEGMDRVDMQEILATKTIRPTVVLDEDGPNYDDDMGLDMSILDEKYVPRSVTPPLKPRSKAARLLDISDEEAIRYGQQRNSRSHECETSQTDPRGVTLGDERHL